MTTTTKRQPIAHGTCKWLVRPDGFDSGLLGINGESYALVIRQAEYRLTKADGTAYHLERWMGRMPGTERLTCDCPDAQYRRQGECKHCRAVEAAMKRL